MNTKQLFVLGASMLVAALGGAAIAQQADGQYVQMAEIEIDPMQLLAYRAAVQEQIDAAIRKEPGVLVLYAASEIPRQECLRSAPRVGSFQEIQVGDGKDGEVAQACTTHSSADFD
jgi:hypothetical protein